MNLGRPIGPLARRMIHRPGWAIAVVFALCAAFVLWASTNVDLYYGGAVVILVVFLPLVLIGPALFLILVRAGLIGIHGQPDPEDHARLLKRVVLAAAVVAVLFAAKVPLRLAFLAAQADFEAIRTSIASGAPPAGFVGTRVGIYRIERIQFLPNTIIFDVTGGGSGFVYATRGKRPVLIAPDGFGRLSHEWYWYVEE